MNEFAIGLKGRFSRVFVAALGFFLLSHGGHFYAIDNYTVYLTAQALLKTGSVDIEQGLAAVPGRGGKNYGAYPIGLSLLQAPLASAGSLADLIFPDAFREIVGPNASIFYGEEFGVFAATMLGPLFGALGAAEFWVIAELLGYPIGVVAGLTTILVASTQFWPAARDNFPHIVVAGLLLLIVCHAMTWRDSRFRAAPIALGCAAALLMLVRPFDAALTLPLLAIYLLRQDWQRVWRDRRFLNSNFGWFLAPGVVSVALIGLHNALRFGNPLAFRESLGFGSPLLDGLYGLLLSRWRGVIFFSPPVAATVPGLILLVRRRRAEGLLVAALIAVYPLGYATYSHWHGDLCWGPRFIVPAVPFAVLPLGEFLMMGGVAGALILLLGLAGLLVQLAGTMVDFQRTAAYFQVPGQSQIVTHWQALLAGKYLDWMPVRLYYVHGFGAAIAYAAAPLAMLTWASVSLFKRVRLAGHAAAAGSSDYTD